MNALVGRAFRASAILVSYPPAESERFHQGGRLGSGFFMDCHKYPRTKDVSYV